MNIMLEKSARDYIRENLQKLDEDMIHKFKQMYAHGHMTRPINSIIDDMDADRLDHAMTQIRNSL